MSIKDAIAESQPSSTHALESGQVALVARSLPSAAATDGPPSPPFGSALAIGSELRGWLPRPVSSKPSGKLPRPSSPMPSAASGQSNRAKTKGRAASRLGRRAPCRSASCRSRQALSQVASCRGLSSESRSGKRPKHSSSDTRGDREASCRSCQATSANPSGELLAIDP